MILIKDLIKKKRDNDILSKEDISLFIQGVTDGSISNEQISALLMAIFLNDLNLEEKTDLTLAMRNSGDVIKFTNLNDKPIVDKHSTGGVGDLVSLPLACIVASCGCYVPMITGKGLGHTGGTSDKLDSIPGYITYPTSIENFKKIVQEVGCYIIGQTANLAPADKRIYAVRDVTGTVESISLIASSILSKKLASGIDYLVMDVKVGSGAFMQDMENAEILAKFIVDIANNSSVPTTALITDMNECLANSIGNALEIKESIAYLKGNYKNQKIKTITESLAVEMLLTTKVCASEREALEKITKSITSGSAAEIFNKMVALAGGPSNILETYMSDLPIAPIIKDIFPKAEGYVQNINNYDLGMCLVHLGGGRKIADDKLDYAVGLENVIKIGDKLELNKPLATIHANSIEQVEQMELILNDIIQVTSRWEDCLKIKPVYQKVI